jgi:hypothetical protein
MTRMTGDEYEQKMEEVLSDVPESFRSFVSSHAYEHGHSSGYEEVCSIASGLVYDLQKPLENYRNEIIQSIVKVSGPGGGSGGN